MKKNFIVVIGVLFLITSCKKEKTNLVNSSPSDVNSTILKDIDGNSYRIIKIGNQYWMAENLKTFKYNDSTKINSIVGDNQWIKDTIGAVCNYSYNSENTKIYGALYNWYAVNSDKLCPIGWKVPSSSDWDTLSSFLGGDEVAGGKLREKGNAHWVAPNDNATDEFGFSALPTGTRDVYGSFSQGYLTYWWASEDTGFEKNSAAVRGIHRDYSKILNQGMEKSTGLPVRCLKK